MLILKRNRSDVTMDSTQVSWCVTTPYIKQDMKNKTWFALSSYDRLHILAVYDSISEMSVWLSIINSKREDAGRLAAGRLPYSVCMYVHERVSDWWGTVTRMRTRLDRWIGNWKERMGTRREGYENRCF